MGNEARHGRLVLSCFVCNILAQIFWHVKEAHRDCLIGNLCCRWGSAQITKIMMKTHSNLFLAIFLSCPFGDSNLRPRDSMSKQLQQMLQLNLFLFTHSFYQLIVESLKQLIGRFNVTSKMTDFYFPYNCCIEQIWPKVKYDTIWVKSDITVGWFNKTCCHN